MVESHAMDLSQLAALLVPGNCPLCRGPGCEDSICGSCVAELNRMPNLRGDPPEGIDRITSSSEHAGVARDLLNSFKFQGRSRHGKLIAGYMADAIDWPTGNHLLVPVPSAPLRTWLRGFDPVGQLAAGVSGLVPVETIREPVLVRKGLGHQRGKDRRGRLGEPPDFRPVAGASGSVGGREVLLIDDVTTTGATLSAAAGALRLAGASAVDAITFTRRT